MKNQEFKDRVNVGLKHFNSVRLTDLDFCKEDLSGIEFFNCIFEDCLFDSSKFESCLFQDCRFHNTSFLGVTIDRCVLRNCFFMSSKMTYSFISGSNISELEAQASSFVGSQFDNTSILRAGFVDTDLSQTYWGTVSVSEVEFNLCNLQGMVESDEFHGWGKTPFIGCTTGVGPQIRLSFKIEPDEYKEKCPRCGGPAYISFNSVDCKGKCH